MASFFASASGPQSEKGLIVLDVSSPGGHRLLRDIMSAQGRKNEAENILKTKDRKRGFSKNEAENILKSKLVTKNHRNSP